MSGGLDITRSNATFRAWMRRNLVRAADQFEVRLTDDPVWGWCLRSVSGAATGSQGPVWLRVGSEREADLDECWTGIPESAAVTGANMPRIQRSTEWAVPEHGRRVRADLMTVLPGQPCSPSDALRHQPALSDSWWDGLRRNLAAVSGTPTGRFADRTGPNPRVRQVFGAGAAEAMCPAEWETVHGDLHWNNLLGPQCGVLDWELWGRGPAGLDAATLFLFSLLVPDVARRVWSTFADVLDSHAGRVARVIVASRILLRAQAGDYADLAPVVEAHIQPLIRVG